MVVAHVFDTAVFDSSPKVKQGLAYIIIQQGILFHEGFLLAHAATIHLQHLGHYPSDFWRKWILRAARNEIRAEGSPSKDPVDRGNFIKSVQILSKVHLFSLQKFIIIHIQQI